MGRAGVARRRIEPGLVWAPGSLRPFHLVVDFEDHALGSVFSEALIVMPLHDWECLHDVVCIVARNTVEMEERSVEFAADQETTCLVPAKRRGR
jgi:hypothetical protein